ncbi:putative mfs multidrug protein [Neofusicoccum parvum UCRNP2]|uniref:Putative mfs multidrug protein n=1 Tax=Botryosphaeria parva (strain UCR-NP2) TaxID=1287680 RepID=R1GGQ4_BOTPV|nr:putative mfs multidrug protein [Neofusicoccum parvum UCRNP2]
MSITAMSSLFAERYGLNETQVGLTFIANGAGSMIGTLVTGKLLDTDYRRVRAAHDEARPSRSDAEPGVDPARRCAEDGADDDDDDFPLERARLRLVPVFSLLQCASVAVFGWTTQHAGRVHVAVPTAATFFTGWTAVSTQSVVMTYLVDVFSDRSAAASASLNLARCLFAAGGTSFVMPMAVALLGVVVQWKFASAWRREAERERRQQTVDRKKQLHHGAR